MDLQMIAVAPDNVFVLDPRCARSYYEDSRFMTVVVTQCHKKTAYSCRRLTDAEHLLSPV